LVSRVNVGADAAFRGRCNEMGRPEGAARHVRVR